MVVVTTLRPKAFGNLLGDVIKKGYCTGCASCVSSCPVLSLTMRCEKPTIIGTCINCEICYYQCPRTVFSVEDFERELFGRTRRGDEPFGVVRSVHAARSVDPNVKMVGTDGSFVTSLLLHALKNRKIDCAVISSIDPSERWKPIPKVAVTPEDVIRNAGTRYTSCPMILGLQEAVRDMGRRSVAFVGTGCAIEGVRKSRFIPKEYWDLGIHVKLAVGLFCMESFTDRLLKEYLPSNKVNLDEATKFHITKGRLIIKGKDSVLFKVPVKELSCYAMDGCHVCVDSTAEFADISVGGIGSEEGWSTVVVRSEVGEVFFKELLGAGCIEAKPLSAESFQDIIKFNALKKKQVEEGSHPSFPRASL